MEKSRLEPIKVSVCISVHNTAKYLPRCLDSVCAQTLQSLEIVVVNNGSTDNSEDIMRDYAVKHPERKFVIVSQEDRSLAGGRQTGIEHASGEYLTFLDADDLISSDAYEKMLACAEREHVDIVEIETKRDNKILSSNLTGIHNSHDVLRQYFTKGGIPSMLWMRMYKRTLFSRPVLPNIYTNNEDMFALPCLLHAAKLIYFIKEPLHTYSTDNEGGVMLSETSNPELAERRFQSRKKALLSIPFFRHYVGNDGYIEYYEAHNKYEAIYVFWFLLDDFSGKTTSDKIQAVLEILDFDSRIELRNYLKKWLPKGRINPYSVYRLWGIRAAYWFNRLVHKNK